MAMRWLKYNVLTFSISESKIDLNKTEDEQTTSAPFLSVLVSSTTIITPLPVRPWKILSLACYLEHSTLERPLTVSILKIQLHSMYKMD
jgi:hypothetical protein